MNNSGKMIHKPYRRFKGFMREQGITLRDIAELLGVYISTVSAKINGKSDFYINEADIIIKRYGCSNNIFLMNELRF